MEIKKLAVIRAGAMGTGIAYACATKGYRVSIRDVNENLVKRGIGPNLSTTQVNPPPRKRLKNASEVFPTLQTLEKAFMNI